MDRTATFNSRLQGLLKATRRRVLRHGWLGFAALGGPTVLAAAWAAGGDRRLEGFLAWGLSLSLVAVLAAAVWVFLARPLRSLRDRRDLVDLIERRGDFANLLVAAEESGRLPERWAEGDPVARELRRRLLLRAGEILDLLTPDQILELPHRRAVRSGTVGALVLALVFGVADPGGLVRGLGRLAGPQVREVVPGSGGLFGEPGPGFVVAGADCEVAARDFGGGDQETVCEIRVGAGNWQAIPAGLTSALAAEPGLPAPYRRWTARIEDVREGFSWRFRRGERVSEPRFLPVRHHPLVTAISARIVPPAYTRTPAQTVAVLPSFLEVPAGSEVQLRGRLNLGVVAAGLALASGDTVPLAIDGREFTGSLTVTGETAFSVTLRDSVGLANLAPLQYKLSALEDGAPVVRLERPQDDGILPLAGTVELAVDAADDFGIAGLALYLRPLGTGGDEDRWYGGFFFPGGTGRWLAWDSPVGEWQIEADTDTAGSGGLVLRADLNLALERLDLVAGQGLEIVAEARDNREPGPANTSRSGILRLILPSASDVLADQARSNEDRKAELDEARRLNQALAADLDRLTRELMKNPDPDWTRQQEMEAALERHRALQDELSSIAEQLRTQLENMATNQLSSPQQLEKAEDLAQLLDRQDSDYLEKLLDKMESGADRLTPEEIARAVQEVARNQQELARRMDAALAMLERMSREQELEGLTSLLEKMLQDQQELADLTRQLAEQNRDAAADSGDQQDPNREGDGQEEGETGEEDGKRTGEDQEGQEGQEGQDDQEGADGEEGTEPEAGSEEEAARLAERQEALNKDMEELQKRMEAALESLKEQQENRPQDQQPSPESAMEQALEQAMKDLERQQAEGKMQEARDQLMQMDPEQAAKLQEQAMRDLGSLYHVLLQSQGAMQMAMQQNQVTSLRGLAADMLALSHRQEEISRRIPTRLRDVRSLDLTRGQHRLQKAAVQVRDELGELAVEAPMRIMPLLKKLDGLIEQMGYGVNALEENRGTAAQRHGTDALAEANNIIIGLLTEAQVTGQGGSGQSSPSQADQLMQMIKEQAKLNGTTEQLRQMLANRGLSQETRAQMKRLGEGQGELARQMKDLADQERIRQDGGRLLGDMAQLGRDMESISGEIDEGLVSEETLIRQERILSRMLDARNSARQRDYSSRRESRTAERLYGDQEGGPGAAGDPRVRLRYQPLDTAPLDYRDLVRRYFSALDSLQRLDADPLPPLRAGEDRGEMP
ncbi:MAG: DUF4175 family protein [bacterium]